MQPMKNTDTPRTAIQDAYQLHDDRGMIYNPLSRDFSAEDIIEKYTDADWYEGTLETANGNAVSFRVPTKCTAYDMVPVEYSFTKANCFEAVHFLATGLEDKNRKSQEWYSNILPGEINMELSYLGYVTGKNNFDNRAKHTGDFSGDRQGKKYPMLEPTDLIQSGVVKQANYYWFRFGYKNVGNTILSVNGSGTFCFEPNIQRFENGEWVHYRTQNNLFVRLTDDCYPGEGGEFWVSFDHSETFTPGHYRIVINTLVRNETYNPENFTVNIWAGRTYQTHYQEFDICEEFEQVDIAPITMTRRTHVERNTWLHTYEEFLTSYDSWLNPFDIHPERDGKQVMYVQVAPWTNCITLKLLTGNSMNQVAVTVPVEVETDSIKVKLDTEHLNYIINDEGKREPAMIAQSMCDMRVHLALGPEADQELLHELMDMKDCGVNLISTTAAFETIINDGPQVFNHNTDAHWFMCDAIKQMGMKLEGWITYPYENPNNVRKAAWITGDKERYNPSLVETVDDPLLAEANAVKTAYQFKRWGDNYYTMGDGRVPVTAEDTRGWHRIDIQNRCKLSGLMVQGFKDFVKEKYGTIEKLNEVWGCDYQSFDEINPEEGTFIDHGWPNYTSNNAVFGEWCRALEDLDIYRTMSRMKNYSRTVEEVQDLFPASIGLRTEGGNWTAIVPADSERQNYRHVYYSQRRVAAVPQVLKDSGMMALHSDYCTLPYTPEEVADLTRRSVELGITPMHMIQADRMRDIAINPHYGQDYSVRYNIGDGPSRGAYISTVISLFGWYKATYENGGIPGVLWEDYLCDGYVTSMQQKEMKFFSQKLKEALDTPEGKAWAEAETVNQKEVVKNSLGVNSYPKDYVAACIAKCKESRKNR